MKYSCQTETVDKGKKRPKNKVKYVEVIRQHSYKSNFIFIRFVLEKNKNK